MLVSELRQEEKISEGKNQAKKDTACSSVLTLFTLCLHPG